MSEQVLSALITGLTSNVGNLIMTIREESKRWLIAYQARTEQEVARNKLMDQLTAGGQMLPIHATITMEDSMDKDIAQHADDAAGAGSEGAQP